MSALGSLAQLESIESRLLLSFASLSSHGTLSVAGTGGSDSITVQFSGTKVQAILNGRVVQRGQDLSLFVELIDVALDKVVWSQQYNRK